MHHPRWKMNLPKAMEVRARLARGERASDVAKDFGVATNSVLAIQRLDAHPPVVPVLLTDDAIRRLEALAAAEGTSVEAVAAERLLKAIGA